ncbi:unnamed protein product [Agarophyton chilense]|eukprot:gb/GEZJ01000853.1/.p2 GENE.gb/GEZJ01000853.1/~~gb/GEZJ01000853.1/.p2  ORF type:complete len:248 (-),score=46.15 gb/GEZJ01000853.1/:869-1612(-)
MQSSSAFVHPSFSSTFTPWRGGAPRVLAVSSSLPPSRTRVAAPVRTIVMQEKDTQKKPLFRNPFASKSDKGDQSSSSASFMEPQPGDPGYMQYITADDEKKKRGLDLLKEDILKSAPERAGVGRQDADSVLMRPQAGEPGYKPAAYQTVRVSTLGISTFSDDKNYVSKVGGIDAVKQAAVDIQTGTKTGKDIKKEVLNKANNRPLNTFQSTLQRPSASPQPNVDNLPDYLKPLPEDTPRKGMSWKNY